MPRIRCVRFVMRHAPGIGIERREERIGVVDARLDPGQVELRRAGQGKRERTPFSLTWASMFLGRAVPAASSPAHRSDPAGVRLQRVAGDPSASYALRMLAFPESVFAVMYCQSQ
jgi:hypothetical protein